MAHHSFAGSRTYSQASALEAFRGISHSACTVGTAAAASSSTTVSSAPTLAPRITLPLLSPLQHSTTLPTGPAVPRCARCSH